MHHPAKAHFYRLLPGFIALALTSLLLSLLIGSRDIAFSQIIGLLINPDNSLDARILYEVRLPRTLSAFAVGGLLSLAGALMQVLLRNPLGDPYVLGVSGGAASAALFGMLLGISGWLITPVAFAGALTSIMIVFGLSRFQTEQQTLLLAGVVIAAFWGALISLTLSLAPPMQLPGMLFWLMGDLSDALQPTVSLFILAIGLLIALLLANPLNVAIYGDEQAHSLGINTQRLRLMLYLLTSLLTASAVSIAGAIGFIGLIIPHLIRLLGASDHRSLLPLCVLAGGSLLVLADLLARTLIAPMQIPVGIFTALLGVPVFIWLLARARG